MKRSHKPIVWGLFAAGGTVSAFLVTPLMFVLGFSVPLGLLPPEALSYERVYGFVSMPIVRLIVFGFIFVSLWHAAHRTRTTVHDLGVKNDTVTMVICYSLAGLGSVLGAVVLFLV